MMNSQDKNEMAEVDVNSTIVNNFNYKKLDIPNFNEEDVSRYKNIIGDYPYFDPTKDIILYPFLSLRRNPKLEKPFAYDGKRCIVAECKGNDSIEHREHMMHIYMVISNFLVTSYNMDRAPDPLSLYVQGVFAVFTELLSPLSRSFHKGKIDTEMVTNTLEELSKQATSVSEWMIKGGMVPYRAQYDDSKIEYIEDQEQLNRVFEESSLVMIDFWADWCSPCHALNPILVDLSHEMSDKIKIVKVNVDEQEAISKKFNISSMPTMVFVNHNTEIKRISGVQRKEFLEKEISSIFSQLNRESSV